MLPKKGAVSVDDSEQEPEETEQDLGKIKVRLDEIKRRMGELTRQTGDRRTEDTLDRIVGGKDVCPSECDCNPLSPSDETAPERSRRLKEAQRLADRRRDLENAQRLADQRRKLKGGSTA
jgi:hypothetical protein